MDNVAATELARNTNLLTGLLKTLVRSKLSPSLVDDEAFFFDIGGDSVFALFVTNEFEKIAAVKLRLTDLVRFSVSEIGAAAAAEFSKKTWLSKVLLRMRITWALNRDQKKS